MGNYQRLVELGEPSIGLEGSKNSDPLGALAHACFELGGANLMLKPDEFHEEIETIERLRAECFRNTDPKWLNPNPR